jgi:hypothetical protein
MQISSAAVAEMTVRVQDYLFLDAYPHLGGTACAEELDNSRIRLVSLQEARAASLTLAAFAAPAKGMMTQKMRMPDNARGTVSASYRDRLQRGQKTGAIINVDTMTATALPADEMPMAASLMRRKTITTAAGGWAVSITGPRQFSPSKVQPTIAHWLGR